MKKRNWLKYIIVNFITSPLKIAVNLVSLVYIVHIRAMEIAQKRHVWLENHENAKRRK